MPDREKVIKGLEEISDYFFDIYRNEKNGYSPAQEYCDVAEEALAMLKEQENEYEKGFNDAMLGKQGLMYEGVDGKWHKKDW